MTTGKDWSDDVLRELYEYRHGAGFSIIYSYLSQSDKENYKTIIAKEKVKKWRNDGSLIGRISNFSKKENEKYSPFIELEERLQSALQVCIIKSVVDLKCNRKNDVNVKSELSRMTTEQKDMAKDFLENELQKIAAKNFGIEIGKIISWL